MDTTTAGEDLRKDLHWVLNELRTSLGGGERGRQCRPRSNLKKRMEVERSIFGWKMSSHGPGAPLFTLIPKQISPLWVFAFSKREICSLPDLLSGQWWSKNEIGIGVILTNWEVMCPREGLLSAGDEVGESWQPSCGVWTGTSRNWEGQSFPLRVASSAPASRVHGIKSNTMTREIRWWYRSSWDTRQSLALDVKAWEEPWPYTHCYNPPGSPRLSQAPLLAPK